VPQSQTGSWNFLHCIEANWTWDQVEAFVAANSRALDRVVVPITRARAGASNGAAAAPMVVEPDATQPAGQVTRYRDTWERIKGLSYAPNRTPYSHMANVVAVIEGLKGKYADVWYDEFHCKVMTDEQAPRAWADADTLEFVRILQSEIGFAGVRPNIVQNAIDCAAHKRPRHEVREWLKSLKWDGSHRLGLMLMRGWGAEAHPYTSAVGRCFLMGAVARVMEPGCKVDNVPVFEGAGGTRKTSSLQSLFGARWFDNPHAYIGEKDFLQNMTGKWCLELAELANIKGRALETVKATITRPVDVYRAAYGRLPGTYKRQCVFAGTIDRSGWNTDQAGGRRWWPVRCSTIDTAWIEESRAQLFAEALSRYESGEPWWNVPEHYAREEQLSRQQKDVWDELVADYVTSRSSTSIPDLLRFACAMEQPKDWSPSAGERVRGILTRLRWVEQPDHSWKRP